MFAKVNIALAGFYLGWMNKYLILASCLKPRFNAGEGVMVVKEDNARYWNKIAFGYE